MAGRKSRNELTNRKSKKRNVTPIMFTLVMVMGLLVGIGSFIVGYRFMMEDSAGEISTDSFSANDIAGQALANLIGSDIDAVITSIESKEDGNFTVTMRNLKNDTVNTVTTSDKTIYPKGVTGEQLRVGDIFTYVFDKENNIKEFKDCKSAWTFSDIGLTANKMAKLVKFGAESKEHADSSYKYEEAVISITDVAGNVKTLDDIDVMDTVRLKGYNNGVTDKVFSIVVEKGHGTLELRNINNIKNAIVSIDGKDVAINIGDPRVSLSEGTHTVTIKGKNISDITKEFSVSATQPYVFDLANVVVSTGALTVYSNVDNYTLYLNDKEYNEEQSILLPYGEYKVRAVKEGYQDFGGSVTIDADQNTTKINMKKLNQSGYVSLTASPENADIYIDDTYVGKGSARVQLALGSYVAKAEAPGYETQSKKVNVSVDGQEISGKFELSQN